MFALNCLRGDLAEWSSTSRHPRAKSFCAPTVADALPVRAEIICARSEHLKTVSFYDYRDRLTGVKQGGTIIATYTYNALDQRIEIQDSGGSTIWTVYNSTSADALPYADFNGSGTLLTRYVSGPGMVNGAVVDELLARTNSGGTSAWYLTDKLDSVRDVVSSSGTELDHLVYDSFGNILTETNASIGDRFKFAGMEYDSTTAQYFDHARGYQAAIGRFTRLDPLRFQAGDTDLYRYVTNSPTDVVDRSGMGILQHPPWPQGPGLWEMLWDYFFPPDPRDLLPKDPTPLTIPPDPPVDMPDKLPPGVPPEVPPTDPNKTDPTGPGMPDHLETIPFYFYNPSLLLPASPNEPPPNTPVAPQKPPGTAVVTPPKSTIPTVSPPSLQAPQFPLAPSKQLPGVPQP
jgi:RHS repeat-associated protein